MGLRGHQGHLGDSLELRDDSPLTLFHLQIILESIEWQCIIILWVVAMEATGGECQRGGFSGHERKWDDSHTLMLHLWTANLGAPTRMARHRPFPSKPAMETGR